ncbi:hypothetical protein [Spirosoma flavum]|uniref:Virion structural protein n=1 Tax=Spirosoma flavum TaxID=2048557 RepID=A0ABW6AP58_9BACT
MKFLTCDAITGVIKTVTASDCMLLLEQAKRFGYIDWPQAVPLGDQATILGQAAHTARMAAVDTTKLSLPKAKLYSPELAGTEPVKVGSNDNTTPDGRSIVRGQTVPMFTAKYTGLTPQQFEDFEDIFARGNKSADFNTMGFVAYLGQRQFMCSKTFGPIPFNAGFIGDPTGMQLHDLTQFNIQMELNKGWFRDVMVVTLNFNHDLL